MPKKPAEKESFQTIRFNVPGIMCSSCAQSIKSALNGSEEFTVRKVYVDWPKKEVCVRVDPTDKTDEEIEKIIKQKLKSAGFSLEPPNSIYSYLIKGIVGSLIGLTLLILMACGVSIPIIALYIIGGVSTLLTLYLGFDSYKSAVMSLVKGRKLNMDALFTVSTLAALGVSIAALFVPWLPMMFDVALLIFGFRHLGIAIEEAARRKVVQGLAFRDRIPSMAELIEKDNPGKTSQVQVHTLKPGDVIRVRKGDIIPVDGKCIDEKSYIYETIYNGSSTAKKISKDYALSNGMKVAENVEFMTMVVTATEKDSYLARVDKRLDKAQFNSAPIETTVDKVLRYFVPAVFILAIISGIVISCFFPPAIAIQCVIATLVSACPCTLGFVVPLAINIGVSKGRDHGVEFKGGKALQAAAEVDTVVFDLNGTLTTGKKSVSSVSIKDASLTKEEVAKYLYLLERESRGKHAIAQAIYHYAKKHKPKTIPKHTMKSAAQKNNSGVRYQIDGLWYTLGNRTMMMQHGIDMREYTSTSATGDDQVVYLARGEKIIAVVNVTDPLRKDAKAVIQQLKQSGKKIYICTGTDFNTAEVYAKKLGIPPENIRADCIPSEDEKEQQNNPLNKLSKTAVVQELKEQGCKVAFAGDGGNDAEVVKKCHLGIGIKSRRSDEVTIDNAGVVIESPSLQPVVAAFEVANQTNKNIKISLGISFSYNIAILLIAGGILVAAGFALGPVTGLAFMIIQVVVLLGLLYYFKRQQLPNIAKTPVSSEPNHSTTFLSRFFKPKLAPTVAKKLEKSEPMPPLPQTANSLFKTKNTPYLAGNAKKIFNKTSPLILP